MNDQEETTSTEATLNSAITELQKISWRLNSLVFGELPVAVEEKEPFAGDKLTEARNQITDVNKRLRVIADRLEIIGK